MSERVWPLEGFLLRITTDKAPAHKWRDIPPDQSPVDPTKPIPKGERIGFRCDNHVCVDIDQERLIDDWRAIAPPTLEVRTAKGAHFWYAMPDPPVGFSRIQGPGTTRAGEIKAGPRHQVAVAGRDRTLVNPIPEGGLPVYDPAWTEKFIQDLPEPTADEMQGYGSTGQRASWTKGGRNDMVNVLGHFLRVRGADPALVVEPVMRLFDARFCIPPSAGDEPGKLADTIGSAQGVAPDYTSWGAGYDEEWEQIEDEGLAEMLLYEFVERMSNVEPVEPDVLREMLEILNDELCFSLVSDDRLDIIVGLAEHQDIEPAETTDTVEDEGFDEDTEADTEADTEDASLSDGYRRLKRQMLSSADLFGRKPPPWLVYRTLPEGSAAILRGKFSTYKSFVALDIGLCVAHGIDWHGHKTRQGRVLYVVLENLDGTRPRIQAWNVEHGFDQDNQHENIAYLEPPLRLTANSVHRLGICELAREEGFDLVIIDTLSKAIPGEDENSSATMTAVSEVLVELSNLGIASLLVAHQGKEEGRETRGHSAIDGDVDTILEAKRVLDEESNKRAVVHLKTVKQKNIEEPAPLVFAAEVRELDYRDEIGNKVSSVVLRQRAKVEADPKLAYLAGAVGELCDPADAAEALGLTERAIKDAWNGYVKKGWVDAERGEGTSGRVKDLYRMRRLPPVLMEAAGDGIA